jgi:hypothetical protein
MWVTVKAALLTNLMLFRLKIAGGGERTNRAGYGRCSQRVKFSPTISAGLFIWRGHDIQCQCHHKEKKELQPSKLFSFRPAAPRNSASVATEYGAVR